MQEKKLREWKKKRTYFPLIFIWSTLVISSEKKKQKKSNPGILFTSRCLQLSQ